MYLPTLRQNLGEVVAVEAEVGRLGQFNHPFDQIRIHRVHRPSAPVAMDQSSGPHLPVPSPEPSQLAFRQPQKLPRLGWAQHPCLQLVQHQHPPLLS